MLREPLGVVAREEWVARDQLAKAIREEHIVGIRKVVVEVRASPETDRVVPLIEGRVGVLEIELVLTDLRRGVQHLALRAADTRHHEPLADSLPAPLPLLELDDHRALASRPVPSTYEAVEPLRREGEPVLEDDAMIVEPALLENLRDCAERVTPRVHLTRRRLVAVLAEEGGLELLGDLVMGRVAAEVRRESGVETHAQSSVYLRLLPRA